VHIRDNLELRLNAYRVTMKGVEVGAGEVQVGQFMAINPGRVLGDLPGTPTTDPTFGLPAKWVDAGLKEQAQTLGYTVVDASTVVATHLSNILHQHAAELLGREEVHQLVDHVAKQSPKLTEDLVPKVLPLATLQKVLQNLLQEGLHIRDMRTILEALAEHAPRSQDADELTAAVRVALGRSIVQQIFANAAELPVIALEPQLENLLMQAAQGAGGNTALEPGLADTLLAQAAQMAQQQEAQGLPAVLLVPAPLRLLLSRFLRRAAAQLHVISHAEVPDNKVIKVTGLIGSR
jgi:flagellar biosynthesis protein FlhA